MKVAYKFVILILTFIATATSIELLPRRASSMQKYDINSSLLIY
jgi:hypothetical protein